MLGAAGVAFKGSFRARCALGMARCSLRLLESVLICRDKRNRCSEHPTSKTAVYFQHPPEPALPPAPAARYMLSAPYQRVAHACMPPTYVALLSTSPNTTTVEIITFSDSKNKSVVINNIPFLVLIW